MTNIQAKLVSRAGLLSPRFFTPELSLFVIGIVASIVILALTGVVLWAGFLRGLPGVDAVYSLENFKVVFAKPILASAALSTFTLALGTVVLNLFFALPIAWLLQRTTISFKRLWLVLMFIPMLMPTFLKGIGWIMLLSPKIGIFNIWLRSFIPVESGPLSIYSMAGMIFIQGVSLVPVMFFMIAGAFQAVDPSFEEAAETSGATRLKSLFRVTFPLVMPAIVASLIYNFMIGVSMFEIAALLGQAANINVFSTLVYYSIHPELGLPQYGEGAVYGIMVLIPALIALYFYQKMLRLSYRYSTVTGKGYRPKMVELGRWNWLGVSFLGVYFLLTFLLPFLTLAWMSLTPRLTVPSVEAMGSLGFEGYRDAFQILTSGGVLANTGTLMFSVAAVVIVLSLIISWIVLRTRMPGRYALDTISMIPHAVPRVTLGFAMAFLGILLIRQVPLYHTPVAIIIALTVGYISFGTRTVNSTLIQIHRDLEDCVQTCGGSKVVALRKVIVPLLSPTLIFAFIWMALLTLREVTIPLFLQYPGYRLIATAIWELWGTLDHRTTSAMGILLTVGMGIVLGILLIAFPQIMGRGPRGSGLS